VPDLHKRKQQGLKNPGLPAICNRVCTDTRGYLPLMKLMADVRQQIGG
jgi:hypothetical protein